MAYRVNLDVLELTIREVSRHLASLEAVEGDVKRAARLVGEHWQGAAGTAAAADHAAWLEGLQQMRDGLEQMRRAMMEASDNYTTAGKNAASMWQV
ncbi:hypothetical protein KEM60_00064 [Austwickia sp. TVS 96-490-7B]|uniref:WXG100 family type VII secretion target n=1 Tax=Austwickia sp. TVS 96-490-7B TaxID=2830843 RepID=UPI001C58F4BA|nr:WXG100 family type VII secretion target [Austwickia sp. TVS 96-490-7B]MBW3083885.1 hypothetical protein [Austwickia sp. TVS 96-490-7B]